MAPRGCSAAEAAQLTRPFFGSCPPAPETGATTAAGENNVQSVGESTRVGANAVVEAVAVGQGVVRWRARQE